MSPSSRGTAYLYTPDRGFNPDPQGGMARRAAAFAGTQRFEIRRELGAGGMGVVYEAFDHQRNLLVALKTLRSVDGKGRTRFKNEFRALEGLEHPNLVSLGELFEAEGLWFFTMELIEGCDFLSYVRSGRLDETRLRSCLSQLARGLLALHERGLVHRDIKPSNILVTREGRTVLMDFGLITETGSRAHSSVGHAVGTPAYMAPEQARGDGVSARSDWYSVGVLLYEALTGRPPFQGSSVQVLMDKILYEAAPPRALVSELPPDLDELCVDLLRREPDHRPSPVELVKRLRIDDPQPSTSPSSGVRSGSHPTQSVPFVGRDRELEELRDAFDAVDAKPLAVLVEGESGIGKSALVEHFVESKLEDPGGVIVLTGRSYEREQVPYKAFDGVADTLCRVLLEMCSEDVAWVMPLYPALLAQLFPVLKRVEAIARAPLVPVLADPQAQRTRMFGAFRELLQRLAQRRKLIIVLDDLQWTCADSLTLFEQVFGHEEAPPVLLLATLRSMDETKRIAISRALGTLDIVKTISLAPLPAADTRKLATLLMPKRSAADIQTLVCEARGHPFFVHELARHSEASELFVNLDGALQARMGTLPAQASMLLTVLCIAGRPITQEVAALAAKLDGSAFSKAASVLRLAHLARTDGSRLSDTIGPYHDRVSEARVSTLAEATRVSTHDALAAAFERTGGDARSIVRHAIAARMYARAAANAEIAAGKANSMMAFDQAAEFYQTALTLGTHDSATTLELRLSLAAALANAGRGPEAAQTFALASESAEPALRRDCQRRAAEQWLITGRIDEGLNMIASALDEMGEPLLSTPGRALFSLLWRRVHLKLRGLDWKARAQSDILRSDQAHLEVLSATASGLSMVDNIRGTAFCTRYLHKALEVGDPRQVVTALVLEASFLAANGNQKRAAVLVQEVERLRSEYPDEKLFAAGTHAVRGITLYLDGRFRAADAALAAAQPQFEQVAGTTFWRNNMNVFRVFCLRHLGEIRKLTALTNTLRRDAQRRGDLYMETSVHRYASRFALLARDQPEEARRELTRSAWPAPEGAYHVQDWYELEARCEIALYAGKAASAAAETEHSVVSLERSLLLRAQPVRILSQSLRARLALASSRAPSRLRAVERLASKLEAEGVGYAQVHAQLLRAAIASQRGETQKAVAELRKAIVSAENNDMAFHLAAARRRLGQALAGAEGACLLSMSDAWMTKEGIVDAERMCEVVAPGFAWP